MTDAPWTVSASCPHGVVFHIVFDSQGYLTRPPATLCTLHQRDADIVEVGYVSRRDRRIAKRALRRFRRQLKGM